MPTIGVTHEIIINGVGYRTAGKNTGNYTRYRSNDFAPRVSMGALSHNDLDGWNSWTMDDWSGGLASETFEVGKANEFYYAESPETRTRGRITSGGKWVNAALGQITHKFIEYASDLYAVCSDGVYKYNNSTNTWSLSKAMADCVDAAVQGSYLVVARGASTLWKFDGVTWTEVLGITGPCVTRWRNKLWRAWGNNIASTEDISPVTPTWTTTLAIGDASLDITSLTVESGYLLIGKADGLWLYDGTNEQHEIIPLRYQPYVNNFKHSSSWMGYLYYPEQARTKRIGNLVSQPSINDVTPELVGTRLREQWGWGECIALSASARWLFGVFDNVENADAAVLSFDGIGWHVLDRRTNLTPRAIFYSPICSKLFVNYGTSGTFYQSYNTLIQTVAEYDTARVDTWYSPVFDAGFPDIDKAFKEIRATTFNASATETIVFYFQADGNGTWYEIGSSWVVSNVRTMPLQETNDTVMAKKIQLKAELRTGDTTKTAELLDISLYYILRPVATYGYRITLTIADQQNDMEGNDMGTRDTQLNNLMSAETSSVPIAVVSPDSYTHKAFITGTRVVSTREKDTGIGSMGVENDVEVTWIDVYLATSRIVYGPSEIGAVGKYDTTGHKWG